MAVVTRSVLAPTVADARLAAEALVSAGAEEVLLFGSVARGDAGEYSDIDLLALFADIDYETRWKLTRCLEETARQAVGGWPVQVRVTDRPEWQNRVENVSASFERAISSDTVRVAESPIRGRVRWDKEMVLPMSNPDEALKQFDDRVLGQLARVQQASFLSEGEEDLSAPFWFRDIARLRRIVQVCTDSAIAVGLAVKSLAVLHGTSTPSEKDLREAGHNISKCLQLVPPTVRSSVETLVTRRGLSPEDLSQWRMVGTYPDDVVDTRALADQKVGDYVATALDVCGFVIDNLRTVVEASPEMRAVDYQWRRTATALAGRDIRTGQPRVDPLTPGRGLDL